MCLPVTGVFHSGFIDFVVRDFLIFNLLFFIFSALKKLKSTLNLLSSNKSKNISEFS